MDVEDAFVHIGSFGKFQIFITVISFLGNIIFGSQMVLMVIVGATPNKTITSEVNLTTIVTEWNLYDKKWVVDLMASLFMAGYIVGSLFVGQLADLYGRKRVVMINLTLMAIVSFSSAFCQTWHTFAITRFLAGFFGGGSAAALFSWLCELLGRDKWALVGMVFQMFFSIGMMLLSGVAYATQSWRTTCIIVSVVPVAIIPAYYFIVPESPRWLYSVGKIERSEEILKYIARMNGRDASVIDLSRNAVNENMGKANLHKYTLLDLFKVPTLVVDVLLLSVLWFAASIVYYGLTLDTGELMPNIYLGLILSGIVELPAYVITIFAMQWKYTGRKGTNILLMLVSALACIGVIFIGNKNNSKTETAKTAFGLISKLCAAGSFSMLYIYNSEIFPTQLRVISIAVPNVFARVAAIIAPFVPLLEGPKQMYVPYVVFGVTAILGAFCNLFLPETLGREIPEMPETLKNRLEVNSTDDAISQSNLISI